MTNAASVLVDTDADNKAADADMALQELGSDDVGLRLSHRHGDGVGSAMPAWPARSCGRSSTSSKAATSPASRESFNAIEAWLGSLPGHTYANVRQPPSPPSISPT